MLDDKGTFVSGAETAIDKDGMSKAAIKKLEKAQEDACVARAKHGKASPATKQLTEMGEKMLGAVEKIDAGAASVGRPRPLSVDSVQLPMSKHPGHESVM